MVKYLPDMYEALGSIPSSLRKLMKVGRIEMRKMEMGRMEMRKILVGGEGFVGSGRGGEEGRETLI